MTTGRKYLSPKAWKELFEAQGCKCCVPGCESDGPFEAEHSTANWFKAGAPDQIMCVAHHKEKTRKDKAAIAKTKRIEKKRSKIVSRFKRTLPSRPMSLKQRARTAQEIMTGKLDG